MRRFLEAPHWDAPSSFLIRSLFVPEVAEGACPEPAEGSCLNRGGLVSLPNCRSDGNYRKMNLPRSPAVMAPPGCRNQYAIALSEVPGSFEYSLPLEGEG